MRHGQSALLAAVLAMSAACRADSPMTTTYFANDSGVEDALRPFCYMARSPVWFLNDSLPRSRMSTQFILCQRFAGRDDELWVELQATVDGRWRNVCAIRFGPVRGGAIPPELIGAVASDPAIGSQLAAAVSTQPKKQLWQTTVQGIRVIRRENSGFSYVALEGCEVAPAEPSGY